jgi:hypothetical protein
MLLAVSCFSVDVGLDGDVPFCLLVSALAFVYSALVCIGASVGDGGRLGWGRG